MSKILVIGCSFSGTCGWKDPSGKVWWHYLDKRWGGKHDVTAVVRDGTTNDELFLQCFDAIRQDSSYDIVFIQWSGFFRQNFYLTNSISGKDRAYFGLNRINPQSVIDPCPPAHKASLIHWQKNFVNAKHLYHKNLDYFITAAELLLLKKLPFVFINWAGRVFFDDMFEEDFRNTSTEYKNEILLWPVCSSKDAQVYHLELYNKMQYLAKISERNWTSLNVPYRSINNTDFADDGLHPGINTTRSILNDILNVAARLGHDL